MTPEQMTVFLKTTQSAAVKGKLEEETPEGWQLILGDLPFKDCMEALKRFLTRPNREGKRGPWINAVDIFEEVRRVRESRLKDVDLTFPSSAFYPKEIEGESEASFARREIEAKRQYIQALAEGQPIPIPKLIPRRSENPSGVMAGVFKSVAPLPRVESDPVQSSSLSPRGSALMRARLERKESKTNV